MTVKENRSTGYSWDITKNTCGSRFILQNDTYNSHPESSPNRGRLLLGAPGERQWVFATPSANSNHIRGLECKVEFELRRPWEKNGDAADTKELTVVVG